MWSNTGQIVLTVKFGSNQTMRYLTSLIVFDRILVKLYWPLNLVQTRPCAIWPGWPVWPHIWPLGQTGQIFLTHLTIIWPPWSNWVKLVRRRSNIFDQALPVCVCVCDWEIFAAHRQHETKKYAHMQSDQTDLGPLDSQLARVTPSHSSRWTSCSYHRGRTQKKKRPERTTKWGQQI